MAQTRGITSKKINAWTVVNNVLLSALARGQFLTALLFLTFIIMVVRMPSEDVSKLMFNILSALENGKLLGYVLSLILGLGWGIHAKWQRRGITIEMRRLGKDRDKAQKKKLGGLLESSEPEKNK